MSTRPSSERPGDCLATWAGQFTYTYLGSANVWTNLALPNTAAITYGYDDDAQLASAVGSGGQSTENLGYTYDAGWNLTQRTSGGAPTNYSVNDRNQVTNGGVNSYSYNANGNRTTKYWYGTSPGSMPV